MNGVRRFLGGASAPPPSQPPPPPPPPAAVPEAAAFVQTGKPSWPPQPHDPSTPASPSAASVSLSGSRAMQTAASSPATPALSIRKDRTRSIPPDDLATNGVSSPFRSYRTPPPMAATPPRPALNGLNGSPNSSPSLSSSPTRVPPPSLLPPFKTGNSDVSWKRKSGLLNVRDDLLMSLLASEAVVDSRECEILSGEEVEELKKEHQMLSARLVAMQKKLTLETKIRDAAISLSRVNAQHKSVSRQTEEQLAAAERRVDEAQRELFRVTERASHVQRRLLEHRAGVLGYTVTKMERKTAPGALAVDDDIGITSGGPGTPSRALSPGASSAASVASTPSSAARFDGAHLFAGHARAQMPRAPPTTADVLMLEAQLRRATDALADANRRQAESARELAHLRLEKAQVEATMSMELQSAEETIVALEKELPRLEALLAARDAWEADRVALEQRAAEAERLERRLEVLEERSGESVESTRVLEHALEEARAERDAAARRVAELEREAERVQQDRDELALAQAPYSGPPVTYTGDSAAIVAQLQPLWDALPAPEARLSKFRAQRHLRGPSSSAVSASVSSAPPSPAGKGTLSDNDVRSLRTLYDNAGVPGAKGNGAFSVEALVARVQALVADDRALIDRLIRSAQAHEMLKRNAERAQKLAEDGNAALQTYQDQVNELEDENMRLVARLNQLSNEVRQLREALDQARSTPTPATASSPGTSATSIAALEAAERAKEAAEAQLAEARARLKRTEEELDSVRTAQGQLQMSLMNEMTDLQTENEGLRAQLRARK